MISGASEEIRRQHVAFEAEKERQHRALQQKIEARRQRRMDELTRKHEQQRAAELETQREELDRVAAEEQTQALQTDEALIEETIEGHKQAFADEVRARVEAELGEGEHEFTPEERKARIDAAEEQIARQHGAYEAEKQRQLALLRKKAAARQRKQATLENQLAIEQIERGARRA